MPPDAHMPDRCDIARARRSADALRADVEQWPPEIPMHLNDVHCRYVVKAQRVADTALAERPFVTTIRLIVPPATDARQGDRIYNVRIAGGDTEPGPFRIEEIARRRGAGASHRSLLLERIGGG